MAALVTSGILAHMAGRGGLLFIGALTALVATGCAERTHLGENGFFAFAMTENTPAFFQNEDEALFLVEHRVELPIEPPTQDDRRMLRMGANDVDVPYSRLPWVQRGDYEIEVDWVLINLDDESRTVVFQANGINEFHEYMPGVSEGEEEALPDFSQWERRIRLDALERRFGTIREEELDEVAVDLAIVVNGVTNANQVVHPDNHSTSDRRSMQFVPDVVPALVGLRVGMLATGAGNIVAEFTVRVREVRNILVEEDERWNLPTPELFAPASVVPADAP